MTNPILMAHITSGLVAIIAGAVAVIVRKGGLVHVRAGIWFAASMFILGATAAILEPFRTPEPGSPVPALLVCYFVATSWVTARRSDGMTGTFEVVACVLALGAAAAIAGGGLTGTTTPVGSGPIFAFAGVCLIGGLGDLNAVLRKKLSAAQRLSRHLWRMCFAFFIATGSFFLGQQDVMPKEVRGAPILFVLAFAPLAIMAFWLVWLRFAKGMRRISLRIPPPESAPITVEAAE